jgi:hypothetical protein
MAGVSFTLAMTGCGSGAKLVPAHGIIKINGVPAKNLLIQYNPVSWPEGHAVLTATAISDDAGNFVLKCGDGKPGVPAGKHKVTVVDNNLSTDEEPGPSGAKAIPNRVPRDYQSALTTPLEITVEVGKRDYELNVLTK